MGRPSKLTPELRERICEYIRAGNYLSTACEACGISRQTYLNWMERGEKARGGEFLDFFDAVKKAEKEAEIRNVAIINKAAGKNWQAAAWWLERRHPEKYGKKDTLKAQLEGRIDVDCGVIPELLKDPEAREHLRGLRDLLARRGAEAPGGQGQPGRPGDVREQGEVAAGGPSRPA